MRQTKSFLAIAGVLCVVWAHGALAEPELRGSPSELQRFLRTASHSVTLEGHSKQTVQADVGHVTVVVHTQAKDLTGAIVANGQRRDTLTKTLVSQGIDAKAIRTEKFSTSPQFGWFGKRPAAMKSSTASMWTWRTSGK